MNETECCAARFRYSLRTGLLSLLAIASAMALYSALPAWSISTVYSGMFRIGTAAISPDGRWIFARNFPLPPYTPNQPFFTVRLWNAESGVSSDILDEHWQSPSGSIRVWHHCRFSNDSRYLLLSCTTPDHSKFKLWDLTTQSEVLLPGLNVHQIRFGHFSPDSRYLALCTTLPEGQLLVYDLQTRQLHSKLPAVRSILFFDTVLVITQFDDVVRVCDLEFKELKQLPRQEGWEKTWFEHASRKFVVVNTLRTETDYSDPTQRHFLVYDLTSSGEPLLSQGTAYNVSPDETRMIVHTGSGFSIRNLRTQNRLFELPLSPSARENPPKWLDNNQLLNLEPSTLYDVSSGHEVFSIPGTRIEQLSPDKSRFVAGSTQVFDSGIYEMASGKRLLTLETPIGRHYSPGDREELFSKNGRHLVMRDKDSLYRWTRLHPEQWYGLAFRPEFWLFIFLVAATLASHWRDRQQLKSKLADS